MITIGKENSVTFAPVEYNNGGYNKLQSFDTRLVQDEYHRAWVTQTAQTYFLKGENIYCQVMTKAGETLSISVENANTYTTPNQLTSHVGYIIWEFYVTLVNEGFTRITVNTATEKSVSECIEVLDLEELDASNKGYLKLQWYSYANTININYDAENAMFHCWVKGNMRQYQPKLNIDVFDNDEETVNLKTVYRRGQLAEIGSISRQASEKIIIASQSDMFLVNHERFVSEEDPEVTMISNLVDLSIPLIQSTVKGINTHDVGFDITHKEVMTVLYGPFTGDAQTPELTPVYENYLLHEIRIELITGADVYFKCGTSIGGNNIIFDSGPFLRNETAEIPTIIHRSIKDINLWEGNILYFTASGTNLEYNIYLDLINIEPI